MAPLAQLAIALAALYYLPITSALYRNGSVIAPCDSPIYCHGDILHQIQLAAPFADSKTFVDMPALKPLGQIEAAFDKLDKPLKNDSALNDFLTTYFADAGQELKEVPKKQLSTNASFLVGQNDTVIKEFVQKVIQIWPDLTRTYHSATNCSSCPNSYVPIKNPFVVAGGRFREPYYWDTYWIVQGLLRTGGSFIDITNGTINNFLDFVETYGFVPNGARVYYLNRSQPPLLSQMVKLYLNYTNDTALLDRALPLLVKEHQFWMTNRTVHVKLHGSTYTLNRYDVQNNQPRPESYIQDYITAKNTSYYAMSGIIYPQKEPLNDTATGQLYGNLASGAETGWDFSTRWISRPEDSVRDNYFPLRYINTKNIVPVDLNSILYGNELTIAEFFNQTGNRTAAREWAELASNRSEAMTAVLWNSTVFSYFDYNLTSPSHNMFIPADVNATDFDKAGAPPGQQLFFHAGQFYPFWMGAAPGYLKNNPYAVKQAYSRVASYLAANRGGIPATNLVTGQQWDQPNVWPPLQHILMEGLLNTPATFGEDDPSYRDVQKLALQIGQRYLESTFCTWYATGGSTSETPQLEGLSSSSETGIMFEKYADNATNVAGGGGEYEVVEGFGWSNGVLIWTADTFGNRLKRPDCGDIAAAKVNTRRRRSAVELHPADAKRIKRFGKRARGSMRRLDMW